MKHPIYTIQPITYHIKLNILGVNTRVCGSRP